MFVSDKNGQEVDFSAAQKKLHAMLMERLDLRVLERLEGSQVHEQIRTALRDLLSESGFVLNETEKTSLIDNVENEVLGLGPLEPLLKDPTVSDILVNTYNDCYVERHGMLEKTSIRFQSNEHLMRIIQKIAGAVGRRVDESSPMVDARLADGSRVNAIIPPLAVDGPLLSIRKFAVDPLTVADLINFRSITQPVADFLKAAVLARTNILISGGTGSGKTTLLNVVSGFIPHNERILTIEDSAELQLQQPHVGRLETRPPNIEGKGAVMARDLVRNALEVFFDIRSLNGLKKRPSTSELIDWLKLLVSDELSAEQLADGDIKQALPPLFGALIKNEQDVHLLERLAFMSRRKES